MALLNICWTNGNGYDNEFLAELTPEQEEKARKMLLKAEKDNPDNVTDGQVKTATVYQGEEMLKILEEWLNS